METYVATGEVTSLKHELRDDAMEGGASISEALLASAESAEVLSSLGDDIVVEGEVDTAGLLCMASGQLGDAGQNLQRRWGRRGEVNKTKAELAVLGGIEVRRSLVSDGRGMTVMQMGMMMD
jgi:hypothetical protein